MAEVASTLRRTDGWAALVMLVLAVAPLFPPASPWQYKLQLVLTEMGAWFGGVCLAGAVAAGVRLRRGMSSFFLALVFLSAAFLFFRPWGQFLSARPLWNDVMDRVYGPAAVPPLSRRPPVVKNVALPGGLSLTLYSPAEGGPSPWVLFVHPGGWDSGSPEDFRWMSRRLARRGWAVASVDYRLAPEHKWPAQRDDVRAAVRYLKSHGDSLGLDPARWALLGRSAGGQIAESVAFGPRDPDLKGVAAFYAPSDLLFAFENGAEDDVARTRPLLRQLIGGSPADRLEAYIDASPLEQVSSQAPPALLLHGPRDPVVWAFHSRRLAQRLAEERVPVVLIEPPWATHGFDFFPGSPGGRLAAWAVERFLAVVFQPVTQ